MADELFDEHAHWRGGSSDLPAGAAVRNILVVCRGNTCRSAMAEGVLKARLAQADLAGMITVSSAGTATSAAEGTPADPRAVAAAAAHGIDLSAHRTRALAAFDLTTFDLILIADRRNLDIVRRALPTQARGRAQLLLDLDPDLAGRDLPDPFGGNADDYARTLAIIEQVGAKLVGLLETRSKS